MTSICAFDNEIVPLDALLGSVMAICLLSDPGHSSDIVSMVKDRSSLDQIKLMSLTIGAESRLELNSDNVD